MVVVGNLVLKIIPLDQYSGHSQTTTPTTKNDGACRERENVPGITSLLASSSLSSRFFPFLSSVLETLHRFASSTLYFSPWYFPSAPGIVETSTVHDIDILIIHVVILSLSQQ